MRGPPPDSPPDSPPPPASCDTATPSVCVCVCARGLRFSLLSPGLRRRRRTQPRRTTKREAKRHPDNRGPPGCPPPRRPGSVRAVYVRHRRALSQNSLPSCSRAASPLRGPIRPRPSGRQIRRGEGAGRSRGLGGPAAVQAGSRRGWPGLAGVFFFVFVHGRQEAGRALGRTGRQADRTFLARTQRRLAVSLSVCLFSLPALVSSSAVACGERGARTRWLRGPSSAALLVRPNGATARQPPRAGALPPRRATSRGHTQRIPDTPGTRRARTVRRRAAGHMTRRPADMALSQWPVRQRDRRRTPRRGQAGQAGRRAGSVPQRTTKTQPRGEGPHRRHKRRGPRRAPVRLRCLARWMLCKP